MSTVQIPDESYRDLAQEILYTLERSNLSSEGIFTFDNYSREMWPDNGYHYILDPFNTFSLDLKVQNLPILKTLYVTRKDANIPKDLPSWIFTLQTDDFNPEVLAELIRRKINTGEWTRLNLEMRKR